MTNITNYHKYNDKYLELFEQFSNYLITYKLDFLEKFPQKVNIIIFDDADKNFSDYSTYLLKNLLKKKIDNVIEVRKTGTKELPWEVSSPINILST